MKISPSSWHGTRQGLAARRLIARLDRLGLAGARREGVVDAIESEYVQAAETRIDDPCTLRGAAYSIQPRNGATPAAAKKTRTRRQMEGAIYTPAFITRYIIEQALGRVLQERFERLRREHQDQAKGAAQAALADPRVYKLDDLKRPERTALVRFWEAWQDELATVRLVDPACGSGAFLIEAFDQLYAAYQSSNDR